jgi:hypothetical protein
MADLVLSVDVTSLADARKKLDGFQKAMNNLSVNRLASGIDSVQNSIKRLVEAQAKGTIGQNAYQKGLLELKRAYEQLGYSSQQATAAVRAYAAQLQRQRAAQEAARAAEELARAQAQAAARTRELRLQVQEGYAAFDRARLQMRNLREALRQGIITTDQYREAIRRLREEQQRVSAATQRSTSHMNRMGVVTQQAGYQIGDFLVQVQSGTNWMVAFGQQATQLAGVMTLFGGKFILIGSILGIVIPLMTAIGAAMMRTRGSGQTLDQIVTKLKESFSELSENMGLIGDADLDLRFGNLTSEIRSLASAMVELNAASELGNLTSVLENLEGQATAGFGRQMLQGLISLGTLGMNIKTPEQVNEEFFARLGLPMGRQDFLGQVGRMQEAAGAGDRVGVVGIFEDMVGQIRQAEGGMAAVSSEGRALVAQMYQAALATAETNAMLNGSAASAARAAEQAERNVKAYEELLKLSQNQQQSDLDRSSNLYQRLSGLRQEAQLQEEIARYGAESAQVAELRATQERANVRLEAMKAGFFNESLDALMEQYDAMVLATTEADKTTAALEELAGLNLGSLRAEIDFLIRRLNIGEEAARALALAIPIGTSGGDAARGGRGITLGMAGRRPNFERDLGIGRYAPREERQRAGGADPLQQLRERLQLEQDLLGKTEAQRRVIQGLGTDWRSYGDATIERLVSMIEEIDEFNAKVAQQEDIANTIAGSFGDAFMSIVDGTKSAKDAFSDMARHIIRRLFEILVIESMVQSIAGAITGAFVGGGPTRPVMRPTAQLASGGSMMAGRPYLVGEHGPELVIPGRSATVKNADLTNKALGGESINIVNNINVSGGTDPAAIRMEVAKLMPQITNATKSAVIDARRRGGQMKAAFG